MNHDSHCEAFSEFCGCLARKELVDALEFILGTYTGLVCIGSAGLWNPEIDKPVIQARAALAKYKESKQ